MVKYFQIPILIVLVALLLCKARLVKWNESYIDRHHTTSIVSGFFLCLVFLHHFSNYALEYINGYIGAYLGQLIVVMFLFYSGFGCVVQLRARGEIYLDSFFGKRILPTILNFWVAVAVFVIWSLVLGRDLAVGRICMSFIGWDSVGNSNWYIFAIVLLYIGFFLSFKAADFGRGGG